MMKSQHVCSPFARALRQQSAIQDRHDAAQMYRREIVRANGSPYAQKVTAPPIGYEALRT